MDDTTDKAAANIEAFDFRLWERQMTWKKPLYVPARAEWRAERLMRAAIARGGA